MNQQILIATLALTVGGMGLAGPSGVFTGWETVPATVPSLLQEDDGPPYNGQFTYVRLRYGDDLRNAPSLGYGRRGWGRRGPSWSHDWPDAEMNFSKIVEATTFIDTYTGGRGGRVLTLSDPELFRYPIATIIEVGRWYPTDEDIAALRAYLLKGGFLIVDDTREERGGELRNFLTHMRRALPGYDLFRVPDDHEIFNSFFSIPEPLKLAAPYGWYAPQYFGLFEDNDPETGRLMVMINWNQDLQEYWEYSDRGYYPIDLSNEAYKFGVNYLIYAFTH
jgi:hypothetical protein